MRVSFKIYFIYGHKRVNQNKNCRKSGTWGVHLFLNEIINFMVNVIIFHFIWKITSSFAKEKFSTFDKLRHRGTIRQRHSRHCLFQTECVISPALKYIFSYSFLTIKQSCTDLFCFVVVQVDMWDGALDETAIPRPLNSAC